MIFGQLGNDVIQGDGSIDYGVSRLLRRRRDLERRHLDLALPVGRQRRTAPTAATTSKAAAATT